MGTYISLFLFSINSFLLFWNYKKGLCMFVVCALTAPTIHLSAFDASYDLFFFFPLLIWSIITPFSKKRKLSNRFYLLIAYVVILGFVSVWSILLHHTTFLIVEYFGYLRLVVYIIILYRLSNDIEFYKPLYVVVIVNMIVVLFQMMLPNSALWSYELWGKSSSTALVNSIVYGGMSRYTGTFSNTLPASFFMLSVFIISYSKSVETKNNYIHSIICLITMICGFFNISKTFIIGFPLTLLLLFLASKKMSVERFRKNRVFKRLFLVIIISGVTYLLYNYLISNNRDFYRYINSFGDGTWTDTRFGEDGVLSEAYGVFNQHPFLGIGCSLLKNEFIGDSQIIVILHHSGIIGLITLFSFYYREIKDKIRKKNVCSFVYIVISIIIGFFGTTIFSISAVLLFCCCNSLDTRSDNNECIDTVS